MIPYYDIKNLLCRIVDDRTAMDNENDIVADFSARRWSYMGQDNRKIIIPNADLRKLYDDVCTRKNEEMELYTDTEYEIAIKCNEYGWRRAYKVITSEDTINGISYELSLPSLEYASYMLFKIKEGMDKQQQNIRRNAYIMRLRQYLRLGRLADCEGDFSLSDILPYIIGINTLKIKAINGQAITDMQFRKHKASYIFDFMYKTDMALIEYADLEEILHISGEIRERLDVSKVDAPPLREYTADVVDYYKLALSSEDPYIKFISFYHVMEYFFDEVFKKKMVNDLKDKITHPDFSYKKDEKLYEIAQFVKHRWNMNNESGQGNELESFKYVLKEYITLEDLKTRITAISSTAVQYYQDNKVNFSKAPAISWADEEGAFTQIAKRIYFTRNALVHSKSGKNAERYRPYKDDKQLKNEIPLVKAVAELIIIHSSKII